MYSSTEQQLLKLWKDMLSTEDEIGIDDDFFSMGGDSMQMIRMLVRVQQIYARELDFEPFLQTPTVRVLVQLIEV